MEEAILTRLREILKTSDLEKTTGKSIRKQLEKELSADLSGYKPVIREEIEKYLQGEAIRQSQESAQTTLAASPSKSKGGYGCLLSPELSAFMGGVFECPRTQVVKELWAYIKSKDLQNPKDRRKINLDEELAKLFKPPLTMLNMNKQLSRHCKTDDRKIASRSPAKKAGAAAGGKGKAKKDKKAAKAKQGSKVSKKGAAKISKKKSSSSSSRKPKAEGEKEDAEESEQPDLQTAPTHLETTAVPGDGGDTVELDSL